jgi:hypothetical protein
LKATIESSFSYYTFRAESMREKRFHVYEEAPDILSSAESMRERRLLVYEEAP